MPFTRTGRASWSASSSSPAFTESVILLSPTAFAFRVNGQAVWLPALTEMVAAFFAALTVSPSTVSVTAAETSLSV